MVNAGALRKGRDFALYVFLPLMVFCLFYLALSLPTMRRRCDRGGDYALLSLEVEKARNFAAQTGPYSRFRFRHPGPVVFYYYAAVAPVFPFLPNAQARYSLAQFLLNIGCIMIAAALIRKFTASGVLTLVFIVIALFVYRVPARAMLQDIWNPSAIVCAVLAFQVASAAVAHGSARAIFPWCLSAFVAVSHHVGSVALIGPIALLALGFFVRQLKGRAYRLESGEIYSILAAVVMGAIALLGPLWESWQHNGGNLLRLFHFFTASDHAVGHSLAKACRFLSSFYRAPLSGIPLPRFLPVILSLALPYSARLEQGAFLSYLRMFNLFSFGFCLWAVMNIQGRLYGYLMMYYYSVVAIAYFLSLTSVLGWLQALRLSWLVAAKIKTLRYLAVVLLFAALIALASLHSLGWKEEPGVKRDCQTIGERLISALNLTPPAKISFSLYSNRAWGVMAACVSYLYRAGYKVCVPRKWGFMFGRDLLCSPEAASQAEVRLKIFAPADLPLELAPRAIIGHDVAVVVESRRGPKD